MSAIERNIAYYRNKAANWDTEAMKSLEKLQKVYVIAQKGLKPQSINYGYSKAA
jgi:hypothetical protein